MLIQMNLNEYKVLDLILRESKFLDLEDVERHRNKLGEFLK